MPRSGVSRRPHVMLCATSAFVLVAACASAPSRAQQPAGAVATAKERPAAEKAEADRPGADRAKDEAARAGLTRAATPIFRALFLAELRFLRVASGASEEQARRMARAARDPLRAAVADLVDQELKTRQEKPNARGFDAGAASASIQKSLASIQGALAVIAKAQLSPDQWTRYRDQLEKRNEHRKQVALRQLLVELEHELRLTAEQRDKLGESLSSHWTPCWDSTGSFFDEDRIFPEIPDPVIVPFLTATQKAAWEKLEKGVVPFELMIEIAEMTAEGDPLGDDLDPGKAPGAAPER
jgi:hypothetical protein